MIMACTSTQTRTRSSKANTGSTYIQCDLQLVSFGENRLRPGTASIWISGTVILSTHKNKADLHSEKISAIGRIPRDDGGPVFAEPWQAHAFALAINLSEQGYF